MCYKQLVPSSARWLVVALALAGAPGCNREPDLVEEHLRRGDQALAEGRYSQALSAYGHAHELTPSSPRVQRARMWARVYLMADDPARTSPESLGDIAYEAELLLESEPANKAKQAVCHTALANVLQRRGDREHAREKLDLAIATEPQSAIAHAALGAFLLERRETADSAKTSFEKAQALDPGQVRALVGLGQLRLAAGDPAGAAERFEAALARRDDFAACLGLGNARMSQGRHAEAVSRLERAVAMDPTSADALSALGQALLALGRVDDAERALRAATVTRWDESTATALGYALVRRKRPDEALGVFGQVLASNASAVPALYGSGVASEDLGRVDQAAVFYERVLALSPSGPQKELVTELQKDARGRAAALASAKASTAASATSAPSAKASASAPTGAVGPTGAFPPSSAPVRER